MVARDCKPGSPPDGTVRAGRRSRGAFRPAWAGPAEAAVRFRAGLPGRGAGAARRPVGPLAAAGYDAGHLPYLPKQPGYHKRLKAAGPLLAAALDFLAREAPSWHDQVRLIDATPVPCGASRETVKRSELAGQAGYGYCAAHSRWYWGLKLYLLTTPDGMPVAWCLASPKLGEREVAAELLAHAARTGALRPGLTLIGDKGFAGRDFEDLVTSEFKMSLIRPDRRGEAPRHGSIGWIRQWIESVNDTLNGQLDLERHGGRTTEGLYARVAQRLLAMAAAIWHNWATDAPVKRSLTAYDH